MKLQEAIDQVASETQKLAQQAEANLNFCKGALEALKRLVEIMNSTPSAEGAGETTVDVGHSEQ